MNGTVKSLLRNNVKKFSKTGESKWIKRIGYLNTFRVIKPRLVTRSFVLQYSREQQHNKTKTDIRDLVSYMSCQQNPNSAGLRCFDLESILRVLTNAVRVFLRTFSPHSTVKMLFSVHNNKYSAADNRLLLTLCKSEWRNKLKRVMFPHPVSLMQ